MQTTPNHLFLCAVGRSGTTILRTSLGLHPNIYYNNRENNIVQDLLGVALTNCTQPSRKFAMVVSPEQYNQIFQSAINELIWPDTELRNRPVHMAAINPTGDQLDYLSEVFPDTRILGLVRNGIEVVASRMRFQSFANQSFENQCRVWTRSQSVLEWGQSNRKYFRLIRHEWFYQPEKLRNELNLIYQWTGIPSSPEPANHILGHLQHPTDSDSGSASNFEELSEAQRAAYFQEKSNRWSDWTPAMKSMFESICGDFMECLGYPIPW